MNPPRALLLALLLTLAACNGDDDAAPEVTASAVTTTEPTTTDVAATTPPTDSPATPPTTPPAPPTTSVDSLKAVIAADVEAASLANYDFLVDPSVDALPAHLEAVAVPGSPVEASLTEYVNYLVGLGDGIIPGEPDILTAAVEQVELVGAAPYKMARVTVCEVENRHQATLSKNTSDGRIIYVEGTGDVRALRSVQDVRLTPSGWRFWDTEPDSTVEYVGRDACPPA